MPTMINKEKGRVLRSVASITCMGDGFILNETLKQLTKEGYQIQATPIFNEFNSQVGEKLEVFTVATYEEPQERKRGIYD